MKRLTLVSLFFLSTLPLSHAIAETHYLVTCSGTTAKARAVFEVSFRSGMLNLMTSQLTLTNILLRRVEPSEGYSMSFDGQALPNHSVTVSFPMDVLKEGVTYKGQFLVKDLSSHETTTDDVDCTTLIHVI